MPQNGIIRVSDGWLLRAGFCSFSAGAGEEVRADVPVPAYIESDTNTYYVHIWTGAAWTLEERIEKAKRTKKLRLKHDFWSFIYSGKVFGVENLPPCTSPDILQNCELMLWNFFSSTTFNEGGYAQHSFSKEVVAHLFDTCYNWLLNQMAAIDALATIPEVEAYTPDFDSMIMASEHTISGAHSAPFALAENFEDPAWEP
jgi:hypothetical protein